MNIYIKGIILGMCDMGCKIVKIDGNKLYFEIPSTFTTEQVQTSKEIINHYGYRLFTKRVQIHDVQGEIKVDRYGTVINDKKEIFTEENGYMVSNFLYEGISSANGGINVGYKVLSKDGSFQGLLDQNKLAVWNTREDSLKLI